MPDITINGRAYALPEDPRTTLLDFLHQELAMFGAKKGCDHGQCGACTVLVNDERMNACLLLAFQLAGKTVTTIEGIASEDALHPLQQAFIDKDAFQCGYCTSGQICSGVALQQELADNQPSTLWFDEHYTRLEDVKERLSGNLCRCGAYPHIVEAVTTVTEAE
ncbi:(2Fe-2S)-binding protein [Salinimonas lutimaris]|uniref:(2Fe-2S)-binding protein n=1 Tax=Salinimonas lutimaris TaxID=914153 RepID=UPI0010C02549|nr:2Fe-2S iron-sulfur cluster-binding protein [Salinimonas lutimaris]